MLPIIRNSWYIHITRICSETVAMEVHTFETMYRTDYISICLVCFISVRLILIKLSLIPHSYNIRVP